MQAALLLGIVAVLVLVPPAWIERLPSVCLNRHIFGFCPGCGSVRALVRLFHGDLSGALHLNLNFLLTGPLLVVLLVRSLRLGKMGTVPREVQSPFSGSHVRTVWAHSIAIIRSLNRRWHSQSASSAPADTLT